MIRKGIMLATSLILLAGGLDFPHPTPNSYQSDLYDFCKDKNTFECAMATYNNVNVVTNTYSTIPYGKFKSLIAPYITNSIHSFDVMRMIVEEAKSLVNENNKETQYFYNFMIAKFYYTPSLQRSIFYLNKKKDYTSYLLEMDRVEAKIVTERLNTVLALYKAMSNKTISQDIKEKLINNLDVKR